MHKFSAVKQADSLVLYAYDVIGSDLFGDGITAKSVAAKLGEAGSFSRIQMRINSPGGDPFEGLAIMNLLKSKNVPIDVHVDGLAASAASLLAMCGSTITMGSGSMFMIHSASAFSFGNADEMRKLADTLDQVSGNMADVYAARTKLPVAEVVALMSAETWFTASEAVSKGFADSVTNESGKVVAAFDLSRFRNVPAKLKAQREEYTREELARLRLKLD